MGSGRIVEVLGIVTMASYPPLTVILLLSAGMGKGEVAGLISLLLLMIFL